MRALCMARGPACLLHTRCHTAAAARGITTEETMKVEMHELPEYNFSKDELQIYDAAADIITRLKAYGFLAYICGGWVRDKYLQRPSLDIDIATSCTPAMVSRLFPRSHRLPRNTVRVLHNGASFEVTTFRGYTRTNNLLSACLDAELRDFTINALFYDTEALRVLDFVGGVGDLQRRVLRLCKDPLARLQEDPLRVLRGVRFATGLRFKLAPEAAEAMRRVGPLCSPEQGMPAGRIWKELLKMNEAEVKHPGTFTSSIRLAFHLGFLKNILPFLATEEAVSKAVAAAAKLPAELPLELRLAAMLHPSSKSEEYMQIVRRFSLHRQEAANVELLHRLASMSLSQGTTSAEQWALFYAEPCAPLCLKVLEAWMPDLLVGQFVAFHAEQQEALADAISEAKLKVEERLQQAEGSGREMQQLAARRQPRSNTPPRYKRNLKVGDLLPPEYLEAIVQSYAQRQARTAASSTSTPAAHPHHTTPSTPSTPFQPPPPPSPSSHPIVSSSSSSSSSSSAYPDGSEGLGRSHAIPTAQSEGYQKVGNQPDRPSSSSSSRGGVTGVDEFSTTVSSTSGADSKYATSAAATSTGRADREYATTAAATSSGGADRDYATTAAATSSSGRTAYSAGTSTSTSSNSTPPSRGYSTSLSCYDGRAYSNSFSNSGGGSSGGLDSNYHSEDSPAGSKGFGGIATTTAALSASQPSSLRSVFVSTHHIVPGACAHPRIILVAERGPSIAHALSSPWSLIRS